MQIFSKKELAQMYWINGSVCAGKTTVSEEISKIMNWNIYHCDAWLDKHRNKASPKKHPNFYKISRITGDELWLRPLEEQIATEDISADEEFELALEDLKKILKEDSRPLLFDGFVTPKKLLPLLPSKNHAFYLIATEEFQLHHYSQRPWIDEVLAKTSNKQLAWHNWMQRDLAAARSLEKQVKKTSTPWLSVDGSISLQETIDHIIKHFSAKH